MKTTLTLLARCRTAALLGALLTLWTGPFAKADPMPRLKVNENKRFLVTADGQPFFWLGDTAWELFHRLDREEATRYLEDRAAKGFTIIQAVAWSFRTTFPGCPARRRLIMNGSGPMSPRSRSEVAPTDSRAIRPAGRAFGFTRMRLRFP